MSIPGKSACAAAIYAAVMHMGAGGDPDGPVFCCVILRDSRGWFVLERRPLHEKDAPGELTCFGGSREEGEDPETCLRREVMEELGFVLGAVERVVVLRTPAGPAWFYAAAGPEEGAARALEEGYEAVWVSPAELAGASIARWNRAAIEAMLRGESAADVD